MSTENPDDVGIAIVGAGGWGRNHVRNFASLPGASLRFVCDANEATRADVLANYPTVRVVATLDEALADPAVRGVIVATPAPTHAAIATLALTSGRDVFVEKPLSLASRSAT